MTVELPDNVLGQYLRELLPCLRELMRTNTAPERDTELQSAHYLLNIPNLFLFQQIFTNTFADGILQGIFICCLAMFVHLCQSENYTCRLITCKLHCVHVK